MKETNTLAGFAGQRVVPIASSIKSVRVERLLTLCSRQVGGHVDMNSSSASFKSSYVGRRIGEDHDVPLLARFACLVAITPFTCVT